MDLTLIEPWSPGWHTMPARYAASVAAVVLAFMVMPLLPGLDVARASVSQGVGLLPVRAFAGVNRPIEVRVPAHDPATRVEALLLDARSGRVLQRAGIDPGDHRVVDLALLFPVLWTARETGVVVAQLSIDGRPVGAGVILQPLVEPTRARNALHALIERSIDAGRFQVLRDIAGLEPERRERLAQQVDQADARRGLDADEGVLSGYRLHRDRLVVLETSLGELTLRLRYDHAPNTAAWFASLAEGGYYDGTAFHRIVPRDRAGHPFIAQGGDPTWTGRGGAGAWVDFEPSTLEHDFGVVSLARRPDDPNSNGAQFFITLSRAGGERLDGRYVSFAEVVEGGSALGLLLSTPVGPRDPGVAGSPNDRPLDPPVIHRAWLRDAPPYPERPGRVHAREAIEVER